MRGWLLQGLAVLTLAFWWRASRRVVARIRRAAGT
ncbi:MAG: hypothetical protein Ct9H300mP1_12660 [Planctomycetaceae bacterium]|nr:MAG: hypothetical protein Ct9H300mP1_12660 [Planctomycetaceae bacterium]